jgi:hypothetical protein
MTILQRKSEASASAADLAALAAALNTSLGDCHPAERLCVPKTSSVLI